MKTYKEWNKEGYCIDAYSKAKGFKDGKPLFDCSQVHIKGSRQRMTRIRRYDCSNNRYGA